MRHLLTIEDLKDRNLKEMFDLTWELKRRRGQDNQKKPLAGKSVGLLFSKSSTRTRVSFEVGVHELGGHSMFYSANDLQIGRGESVPDTARVLSRYLHGVVIRTFEQKTLEEFARHATIPVINGLTNEFHPCQALADMFTIYERRGQVRGAKLTYLGDGASNMANSLVLICELMGVELTVCSPVKYAPKPSIIRRDVGEGKIIQEQDPAKAVANADFLYTDVWVSMGYEDEKHERAELLKPYQLNAALLAKAPQHAKVLHCLPARRGMEITDEVLDSERSIVFDQAENRLHVQKAILSVLVGDA